MSLTTSVLYDDHVALLALGGELDLAGLPGLAAVLDEVLAHGLRQVVVDLSGLTFCDSSGLGALLRVARRVMETGGTCQVAGATGRVARLFSVTAMEQLLVLVEDVAEALRIAHAGAENTRPS